MAFESGVFHVRLEVSKDLCKFLLVLGLIDHLVQATNI